MKSIQGKFLSIVISGILIIAVALSSICLIATNSMLHRDADIILNSICQKEAAGIDDVLDIVEKSVSIMEHYTLQELVGTAVLGNSAFRHQLTEDARNMFSHIVSDTPEVVSYYLRFNPEFAPPTAGFFVSRTTGSPELTEKETTDLSLYSPDDEQVAWYHRPVEAGKAIWMSPYYNREHDILMVSYVAPLYESGELAGIVGVDIDFSMLVDKTAAISVYENGRAYLTGSSGIVYNDPGRERNRAVHSDSRFSEASVELRNGMMLMLQASYDDIQRESTNMINKILIALAVVILLFTGFTIFITRRLVAPLKNLTYAAQQLASGKTDVQVSCKTKDEIGTLSTVFNQTAQQLHEYMSSINTLAYHDSLTGVRNRTSYIDAVEKLNRRIEQGLSRFAVVLLDINYLKQVNDRFGHPTGSELIKRSAKIICSIFKHSPVFRVGGDEFVVFLENDDYQNRAALIEELDRECAEAFIIDGVNRIPVSVARGLAEYDPETDERIEDVAKKADHRMYAHKEQVKSSSVFAVEQEEA